MLGQDIPAICCANKGGNVTANPSTGLMVAPTTSKTIATRDVPFPMVDPYAPVVEMRAPVTGLDAWPYRKRLGKRYYGLSGLGFGPDIFDDPGVGSTTISSQGVRLPSTPSTLSTILTSITQGLATIPAIISAGKQQPYYNPAQLTQQQQTLYGQPVRTAGQPITSIGAQTGAALGNLGDTFGQIVAQHPYLVMGGGLALLLMFMKPPGRR